MIQPQVRTGVNLTSYAELAVRLVNTAYRAPGDPDPLGATSDFRALVSDRPKLAAAVTGLDLQALLALRDELGELFTAAATGRDAAAMDHLNALLARSPVQPELVTHDDQPWHVHLAEHGSAADQYAAGAVVGLALTVSQYGLARLGICSIASCQRVFIDASSNRSRRYCPEHCATRANVTTIRSQAPAGHAATAAS
ncbi:MAG TPA: CGNR zinc finger domain-containing protein [Streptosporangiaceae bacterium]|jgi:predicted RNA-binding Zn ribbon-like protein|nr:CGNR zinc finger domain-containing protein [Streptosporangiaceae bacterium]